MHIISAEYFAFLFAQESLLHSATDFLSILCRCSRTLLNFYDIVYYANLSDKFSELLLRVAQTILNKHGVGGR